jgi:GTP cyclohydrolase IB
MEKLPDIQNSPDNRRIPLDKVGIKRVRYPIVVRDRAKGEQHTIGEFSMYVNLPEHYKGTHMSRFVEVLERHKLKIGIRTFKDICMEMLAVLSARVAHLEVDFPYFISKKAPVSGAEGLMSYQISIEGRLEDDRFDMIVGIAVPIQTLCPCSKELAKVSAHTQRGLVRVFFRSRGFVWIEDIIEMVESCASSPIYSILKTDDEKFMADAAFEKPAFVEDVTRDVALRLKAHPEITWFAVEIESFESIHNHSAFASIEVDKTSQS